MADHIYSVGRQRVWAYCDTAEEAWSIHLSDGKDARTGVYRWDHTERPDGSFLLSNPVRLSRYEFIGKEPPQ